jgi:hypothetical protein
MDNLESPIPPPTSNLTGPANTFFGGYKIGTKPRFYADPSVHGFNSNMQGEHALLVAVVWRAVRDLESDNFVTAMDARRFFLARDPTTPFSLDWIMSHFSRSSDEIRAVLQDKGLI